MYSRKISKVLMIALIGVFVCGFSAESFAKKRVIVKTPRRRTVKVVKLPTGHKKVVVKGTPYYQHGGVFYKRAPRRGYTVVRAPIGARIGVLPRGYVKVRIGPLTYFHHYGTYYRYDPVKKVYVVVEKPAEVEEELVLDRITLVDGKTIDGIYMGGTQSTIQFEVDGELEEIAVEEIASIKFVPVDTVED